MPPVVVELQLCSWTAAGCPYRVLLRAAGLVISPSSWLQAPLLVPSNVLSTVPC